MKYTNKIKIDEFTGCPDRDDYEYSVMRDRIATTDESNAYFENRHSEADRSEYDSPGSVRGCPCDECNAVRVSYGYKKMYRQIKTRVEYFYIGGDEVARVALNSY